MFIPRDQQCIEFRDTNDLAQILYAHSVAPHKPGRLCTVGSSFLLYEDQSKMPRNIHWLDCNEAKPKLLKERSFTIPPSYLYDIIAVRIGPDEMIIGIGCDSGIHCYSTTTKSLKWEVAGQMPGILPGIPLGTIYATGVTTDGCGHLFVSDYGWDGNNCIHMFSVSDGQYLGCLIKEGEQGVGYPRKISWHSASHSLAVAHGVGYSWSLSMINMKY